MPAVCERESDIPLLMLCQYLACYQRVKGSAGAGWANELGIGKEVVRGGADGWIEVYKVTSAEG